ncbi:MAG: aldehyde dehydrogenase family protein, partial [Nitrospinales bacterium]
MAKLYKNFINGEWRASESGETFDNVNPANPKQVLGRFQKSTRKDVELAVAAAAEAQKSWRKTPAPKRGEILYRVAELLAKQKDLLAKQMTQEMGKILNETRGDVQE